MTPFCQLCHKEMTKDVDIERAAANIFVLFYCHLCQSPVYDSMYKELYSLRGAHPELICATMVLDDFFLMWKHNYDTSSRHTLIYKDIRGTVAHSVHLYPITLHEPLVQLNFNLELPLHDIPATLRKLQVYTVFA